jgi:hypothetical protein
MVIEVYSCLLGKAKFDLPAGPQASVWVEAAAFLAARIQIASDHLDCEHAGFPNRKADMSEGAAQALRKTLGQLEAAILLMSNKDRVSQDITNQGPGAIGGGQLTQLTLKRVDPKQSSSVSKMVTAVGLRLQGGGVSAPSTPQEALAWMEAATYLSGRIQQSRHDCPDRKPDMSPNAAKEMRAVLAQFEAGSKLASNREKVVKDITNSGPTAVNGGDLTQQTLKRVDRKNQAVVDAAMREVCSRLFGSKTSEPSTPDEAKVWTQAAIYFNGRIQASAAECHGRAADMSKDAAAAMRAVLAQIPNQSKMTAAPAAALHGALGQI